VVIFRALNVALQLPLDILQRLFELCELLVNDIAFLFTMCFDSGQQDKHKHVHARTLTISKPFR
jgi:hypothetical protein